MTAPGRPETLSAARSTFFPSMDGVRAVAALSVLVYHTTGALNLHKKSPLGAYTALLGTTGVAIFFVISGFLLYRPYAAAHLAGAPSRQSVATFYRRRFTRIYPAYWLALFVYVYVAHIVKIRGWLDTALFFGLLHVYRPGRVLGGLGVSWTLCIEVSFYAALPAVAWCVARSQSRSSGAHRRRRAELAACMALMLGGLGYRWFAIYAWHAPTLPRLSWLPAMLDWFSFGMIMAVFSAGQEHGLRLPEPLAFVASRPYLCWFASAELFWLTSRMGLPRGFEPAESGQVFASHIVIGALALCLVLPAMFEDGPANALRHALRHPTMAWLGTISYGIFLWHRVWIGVVLRWMGYHGSGVSFVALLFPVLLLTVVSAWASFVLIEAPLMRLRGRRRRRELTAATSE